MKSTKGVIPTNIMIFIIGLILVIVHGFDNLMDFMILMVGVLFLVPSLYTLLSIFLTKKNTSFLKTTSNLISSLGAILMGVFMMVQSSIFKDILVYIFIGLILVGGIFHIFLLLKDIREVKYPLWFFGLPVAMLIIGFIALFTSIKDNEGVVVLITGISFMAFAFNSLIEYKIMRSAMRAIEEASKTPVVQPAAAPTTAPAQETSAQDAQPAQDK